MANGTAELAHLAAVASAWLYNVTFKRTAHVAAVRRQLRPAAGVPVDGGLGGGLHGSPPTIAMPVLAALLGIGIHFLTAYRTSSGQRDRRAAPTVRIG